MIEVHCHRNARLQEGEWQLQLRHVPGIEDLNAREALAFPIQAKALDRCGQRAQGQTMENIKAEHVHFTIEEEPLALRLAAALLLRWPSLPTDIRDSLRMQAILTEIGDEPSSQMAEQIDALIRAHAGQA